MKSSIWQHQIAVKGVDKRDKKLYNILGLLCANLPFLDKGRMQKGRMLRMKVLQINCVYKTGSTGKIVNDTHVFLKSKGIESVVCYGRGKTIKEEGVYRVSSEFSGKLNNVISRFRGYEFGGCHNGTRQVIRVIKKEKPDIVHLHCINGFFVNYYTLLNYLKKNHIPTVLTSHAEFFYTGNCYYSDTCMKWKTGCGNCPRLWSTHSYFRDTTASAWKKLKAAFDGFEELYATSVSKYIQMRAEESPILAGHRHTTVTNGLETSVFKKKDADHLKKKHGISDEKVIVHVTAGFSNPLKGGEYVIALAERLKKEKVKIILIGSGAGKVELPANIIYVGRVENQDVLADYYSMADLTVITSKRETFSMPVAESLACGTPVVGFKAGGPESIAIPEYSEFVGFADMDAMVDVVKKWLARDVDSNEIAEAAQKVYSKEIMGEKYLAVYKELFEKYGRK